MLEIEKHIICPKCGRNWITTAGLSKEGKQKYKCKHKNCRRCFVLNPQKIHLADIKYPQPEIVIDAIRNGVIGGVIEKYTPITVAKPVTVTSTVEPKPTLSELVQVFKAKIGGEEVDACDARSLHTYLQNGDLFANWIGERIKKHTFIENQDFVVSFLVNTKKPQGGRPSTEYHITLDMGKELALLENNAIGKEVRKYFIAQEKIAQKLLKEKAEAVVSKSGSQLEIEANNLTKSANEAAVSTFETYVSIGKALGCPIHYVQSEAIKQVNKKTGIDFSNYLLSAPAQDNIPEEEMMLEVTEIGKMLGFGDRQGARVNILLQEAGLQYKEGIIWYPTEAGKPLCARHQWSAKDEVRIHKEGYNLKWNYNKVKHIISKP